MWVVGLILFAAFYKLFLGWYLHYLNQNILDRPLLFERGWFHPLVCGVSLVLFGWSVRCFYATSPWLIPVPFVLGIALFARNTLKRESQINALIKRAIVAHYELQAQGLSQPDLFTHVAARVLGKSPSEYENRLFARQEGCTLEEVILYVILAEKGLYTSKMRSADPLEDIRLRERIEGYRSAFERIRAANAAR